MSEQAAVWSEQAAESIASDICFNLKARLWTPSRHEKKQARRRDRQERAHVRRVNGSHHRWIVLGRWAVEHGRHYDPMRDGKPRVTTWVMSRAWAKVTQETDR